VSFFQLDDKLAGNPKVRRLIEGSVTGDHRGMAALALWSLAGTTSQDSGLDGLLSWVDLARITVNPDMNAELAGLLVDAGLWHGPGHTCEHRDCAPVPEGHWRFHQFWQFGYDDAATTKTTRGKRAELKDPNVRDQVWARDCVDPSQPRAAHCRYCGRLVQKKNTSSKDLDERAHIDHVDPSKAGGVRNLVVCCGGCNREKGQRTPAQAGMTLRPAPAHSDPSIDVVSPPLGAAGTTPAPSATSPRVRAAEAPQDCQGGTTSPDDARGPQGPAGRATEAVERAPGAEQEHEQSTEHDPAAIPGRTRGGGHAGAGGVGHGRGMGRGAGEGSGKPRSRRARRRGRGRPQTDQRPSPPTDEQTPAQPQPLTWDAGPAPDIAVPGQWGSPYYGPHGRRRDDDPETYCQHHPGEHLPCRRCRKES
jgi:5-methylcytosine-specific restriction endonuclease McrA